MELQFRFTLFQKKLSLRMMIIIAIVSTVAVHLYQHYQHFRKITATQHPSTMTTAQRPSATPPTPQQLKARLVKCATNAQERCSLHQFKGISLNTRLENGRTALILATLHKNVSMFHQLINARVDTRLVDDFGKKAIDYTDRFKDHKYHMSLIMLEAEQNAPKFDGELISQTISYDKRTGEVKVVQRGINRKTWSPLIKAIEASDMASIQRYIAQGQYLEQGTNNDSTPIFAAIQYNNMEVLDALIKAGVNLEHQNNSEQTPLYFAVIAGNEAAIKRLIEAGADMHYFNNSEYYTPFTRSILNGAKESLLKVFLDHGANANHPYPKADHPLTIALNMCRPKTFKLLLDYGADPNIRALRDDRNWPKIDDSCSRKDRDALSALLKRSGKPRLPPT